MTTDLDYSVRVKNGAGWRQFGRVRLMISVGQDYHEGKKLLAVVNWINRNPSIKAVHVSVNDLLQRHNYLAAGMSETEAANVALAEGSLWLGRNEGILAEIKAEKTCTRWKDWLARPDFENVHQALLGYEQTDAAFADLIATDACSLAERKAKRGEPVPDGFVDHSQKYVEEEMTVFAMQAAELPAAEVYPGTNLSAARYLSALAPAVKEALPERIRPLAYRHFTRIDFDRINVARVVVQAMKANLE